MITIFNHTVATYLPTVLVHTIRRIDDVLLQNTPPALQSRSDISQCCPNGLHVRASPQLLLR
jgi:hypothetical protein